MITPVQPDPLAPPPGAKFCGVKGAMSVTQFNDDTCAVIAAGSALHLRPADARFLALHIEGREKLAVLEKAEGDGPAEDMPVRAVLRSRRETPIEIFWAPAPSEEG